MYRKIIAAVDSSPTSMDALEQTLTLAASEESEVLLVSVVPAYEGDLRIMGDTSVLKAMREPYEEALATAADKAAQRGVRFRKFLETGDPCDKVLDLAEDEGADLIALGRKDSLLFDLVPVGSMAAKVLKLSDVDVLVIPPSRALHLDRIYLAYDGSKGAEAAADKACGLAVRYGSTLVAGTVYELSLEGFAHSPVLDDTLHAKAEKIQAAMREKASRMGVQRVVPVVGHGDPVYRALAEQAARHHAGIIVIGSHGIGGIRRMLLGSVTERVIAICNLPVLVVKS